MRQSVYKPLTWKRFIDDVFWLWDTNKEEIEHFIEQTNLHHVTIKFTADVSQSETTFLDTTVYQGERFEEESILDVRTHYKPLLKHFSRQTTTVATQQASKKASLKEKLLGS